MMMNCSVPERQPSLLDHKVACGEKDGLINDSELNDCGVRGIWGAIVNSRTWYDGGHARFLFFPLGLRTVDCLCLMSQLPVLAYVVAFCIPQGAVILNRLNLGKREHWNRMGAWYRQIPWVKAQKSVLGQIILDRCISPWKWNVVDNVMVTLIIT